MAAALLLLAAVSLRAQVTTSSMSGRIYDQDGPVEGATVVAVNSSTGMQYSVTTGRSGFFNLLNIQPGGPYVVRVIHFSYDPVTVRGVWTYAGENTAIDADLDEGTSYVRTDGAASRTRISGDAEGLPGGVSPAGRRLPDMLGYMPQKLDVDAIPLWMEAIGQMSATAVPFDVRESADISSASVLAVAPSGGKSFSMSAFDFYTMEQLPCSGGGNLAGYAFGTPVGEGDFQIFNSAVYESGGPDERSSFSALARADWRIDGSNSLDATVAKLGGGFWGSADLISGVGDGFGSNSARINALTLGGVSTFSVMDDFTIASGRNRFTAGAGFLHYGASDTSSNSGVVYIQDEIILSRKFKVQAGLRFGLPLEFSPRFSFNYDFSGNGRAVLRGGTAIYGWTARPSVWKNLIALDFGLPASFKLSIEGIYGQQWAKLLVMSSRNVLDSYYAFTARLERPMTDNLYALAAYTRASKYCQDRAQAGFTWRSDWSSHASTSAAVLYNGCSLILPEAGTPADGIWRSSLEARVSQDIIFGSGARRHCLGLYADAMFGSEVRFLTFGIKYSIF